MSPILQNSFHDGTIFCLFLQQTGSNTMKAYTNGSIQRQYIFDANYFKLLMGLRSIQKSEFKKTIISIFKEKIFWVNFHAIIVLY